MSALSILMIDDNAFFARHVRGMCVDAGAAPAEEWYTAECAAEGLVLAETLQPAAILLDPTLHADEFRLEEYCRELAAKILPGAAALLFLHNPLQQFQAVLERLGTCPNLSADALAKPFTPHDLQTKLEHLHRLSSALTPSVPMATPESTAQKFSWIVTLPDVTGYAHIGADGGVIEWSGNAADEAGHGALIYMLSLASLCGEELGLGAAAELQTLGKEGSAMAIAMSQGAVLNVLGSPRANLRGVSTRAAAQPA